MWGGFDTSLSVLDGYYPATWGVGLYTESAGSNGVLPANGCYQCWHWLRVIQECFKIWHKQFGSGRAIVWSWHRHHITLTSHADGENAVGHMQWRPHDNASESSCQYPCENKNELQLCCAKCQALTSHRPDDSRHLTDAACQCTPQTVSTEKKHVFLLFQSEREPS